MLAQRIGLRASNAFTWRRSPAATPRDVARSNLVFATLTDPADVIALRDEWVALFATHGRPQQVFQSYEWLAIWTRVYLDRRSRLAVVIGRRDGHLVLVWPLVVTRILGLRILTGMGDPVSQYTDAVMAPDLGAAGEDAALAYVLKCPADLVSMRRVRDDAAIAPVLRRRFGAPQHRAAAPYVSFAGIADADAFEARFSGKLRSSRRRRRRRAEERGALTFTSHRASPEAAGLIERALAFKREWARRTGVLAPALRDPRFQAFFVEGAFAGAEAPDLHVSVLRCAAEPIGIEISVACKGRLFGHVLAPSLQTDVSGAGGLLAEATLLGALAEGFETVDLLAPADAYKLEWTLLAVGVCDHALPMTLAGRVYLKAWLGFGREAAKTMMARARPALAILTRRRPPLIRPD